MAAIAALGDDKYLLDSVKMNSDGYSQLVKGFEAFKLNYIPSYENFIAVECKEAMITYNNLLKEGVIVRPVEMENYLRISIGTPNENDHLLEALGKVL